MKPEKTGVHRPSDRFRLLWVCIVGQGDLGLSYVIQLSFNKNEIKLLIDTKAEF